MKTGRSATIGGADLRMIETRTGWQGVVWYNGRKFADITGEKPEALWQQLLDKAAETNPKYVGFAGAMSRFRENFKDGFSSNLYLENERSLKDLARSILNTHAPLEDATAPMTPQR